MSRRRYITSEMSYDRRINELTHFAALLYTWLVPHADDYGVVEGDAEVIRAKVFPMQGPSATTKDVDVALKELMRAGLIIQVGNGIAFPASRFYEYQSYISTDRQMEGCERQQKNWAALFPERAAKLAPSTTQNHAKPQDQDKVDAVVELLPTKASKNARKIVETAIAMYPFLDINNCVLTMRGVLDVYNKPEHKNRTDWATLFAKRLSWTAREYLNGMEPHMDDFEEVEQQRRRMASVARENAHKLLEEES